MNRKLIMLPNILVAFVFSIFPLKVFSQNSTVSWSAFDSGFGVLISSNTVMSAAAGQVFVGATEQANTRIESGFLADTLKRGPATSVSEKQDLPLTFALSQNHPNPFSQIPRFAGNPSTTIRYEIPYHSRVEIHIYNMMGQQIASLLNEEKEAGRYEIIWDGKNREGQHVNSGVYLYQLRAGDFVETKKLLLLK